MVLPAPKEIGDAVPVAGLLEDTVKLPPANVEVLGPTVTPPTPPRVTDPRVLLYVVAMRLPDEVVLKARVPPVDVTLRLPPFAINEAKSPKLIVDLLAVIVKDAPVEVNESELPPAIPVPPIVMAPGEATFEVTRPDLVAITPVFKAPACTVTEFPNWTIPAVELMFVAN